LWRNRKADFLPPHHSLYLTPLLQTPLCQQPYIHQSLLFGKILSSLESPSLSQKRSGLSKFPLINMLAIVDIPDPVRPNNNILVLQFSISRIPEILDLHTTNIHKCLKIVHKQYTEHWPKCFSLNQILLLPGR
jgi:hypothetical protein